MAAGQLKFMKRFLLITVLLLTALSGVCLISYLTVPMSNMPDGPYDAILVLGVPAKRDGSLSSAGRIRVETAVAEYRRGRAPVILFSGGAASNPIVEAHAMAQAALEMSVPPANVLEEGQSLDTLQNIQNSQRILDAHGWNRVEVISTTPHLHRAAVLLSYSHLHWHSHPCARTDRWWRELGLQIEETFATAMLRTFGPRMVPVMHVVAKVQHRVGRKLRMM